MAMALAGLSLEDEASHDGNLSDRLTVVNYVTEL
jgi:hypothetical protein